VIATLSFRFDLPRHTAEAAVLFRGVSSDNKVSEESQAIYNAAVQEVTVLLRSSAVHTIVAECGKVDTPNSSEPRAEQAMKGKPTVEVSLN
jgi:hypothetical protein